MAPDLPDRRECTTCSRDRKPVDASAIKKIHSLLAARCTSLLPSHGRPCCLQNERSSVHCRDAWKLASLCSAIRTVSFSFVDCNDSHASRYHLAGSDHRKQIACIAVLPACGSQAWACLLESPDVCILRPATAARREQVEFTFETPGVRTAALSAARMLSAIACATASADEHSQCLSAWGSVRHLGAFWGTSARIELRPQDW